VHGWEPASCAGEVAAGEELAAPHYGAGPCRSPIPNPRPHGCRGLPEQQPFLAAKPAVSPCLAYGLPTEQHPRDPPTRCGTWMIFGVQQQFQKAFGTLYFNHKIKPEWLVKPRDNPAPKPGQTTGPAQYRQSTQPTL